MGMLATGIPKDQIIASLSISKNTLNNHRSNILKKLSVRNNAELTKIAMQHGYIG
jgi:DNA-binding CsgD family transcriptional regulator